MHLGGDDPPPGQVCTIVAVERISTHSPISRRRRAAVFAAVNASALKRLPKGSFVLATWSTGKVGRDIHVKVRPRVELGAVDPATAGTHGCPTSLAQRITSMRICSIE